MNIKAAHYPLMPGSPILQTRTQKGAGFLMCGYCGKDITEILMYKGRRGYAWVQICPDRCHPDKYDHQYTVEV
ncbi:MAG: hypothetical protein C4555_03190 [Dehalococcoidia bacterium]|nr:MAG: hypothetical protein C4555_03190 [Dehalococcoidia bacterium]